MLHKSAVAGEIYVGTFKNKNTVSVSMHAIAKNVKFNIRPILESSS